MIVKMSKLFIYGLSGDSSRVLNGLQKLGCVQVQHPETMPEYEQIKEHITSRPTELYNSEQRLARLGNAISALAHFEGKKSLLAWKKRVGFNCVEDKDVESRADEICESIENQLSYISELKSKISRQEFIKMSVAPWLEVDLPLEAMHTGSTSIEYLTFPAACDFDSLETQFKENGQAAYIIEVSSEKDQKFAILLSHRLDLTNALEIARKEGGSRVTFEGLAGTPKQCDEKCDKNISKFNSEIEDANQALKDLSSEIDTLKLSYDVQLMKLDCGRAHQKLMHTEKTFIITSWVPKDNEEKVTKYLNTLCCYYEYTEPTKEEDQPVLLKNNKWVEPFQVITEMYSLPAHNSMDPDGFIAIFYFIFFGMMLSDAGYGLILVFGSLFALKYMDLGSTAKKFMKLLALCGISTVIWGAIYGSWFGNIVQQFSITFLNKQVVVPTLLDPLKDPITILIISFALGAIHLFTAMGLSAYLMIRRGNIWGAIFDVGFWYLVLIGLPSMLLPGVVGQVGKYMAIIGAIGLILTQGRDKKGIISKLTSGVLSLYNITGYFSDLLSYSRILALGLATGVIANVVNIMGTLSGKSFIGIISFVLICVFGHALNLSINALGAYVHASRLQYVEFFGKFYEGGGKPFQPLAAKTKYVVITENEEDN